MTAVPAFVLTFLIPTLLSFAIPYASSVLNSPATAQLPLVPACSTSCHFTPVPPGQGLPDGLSCVQALMLLPHHTSFCARQAEP